MINKMNLIDAIDNASSKLVSCQGCTKCCEKGIAYVLPEEKDHLQSIDVPLIEIDGINFIKRKSDGSCTMLDKEKKRCSIYENRPLCCRAFPLDIFSRHGKLEWAVYTYCPTDRVIPIIMKEGNAEVDFNRISELTTSIEHNLTPEVIKFIVKEDKVAAQVEILDDFKDDYKILKTIHSISTV